MERPCPSLPRGRVPGLQRRVDFERRETRTSVDASQGLEAEAMEENAEALRSLLVDIGRAFTESQRMANGQTDDNLHTVGTAGLMYFEEHGEGPPDWATLMDGLGASRSAGLVR